MDPLSTVLALLRPRSYISAGLDAGGEWAMRFGAPEGVKFNAIMRGAGWLLVDGETVPQRLEQGDCFLLTRGRPFVLASDLSLDPIDAAPIYAQAGDGVATCNGGGDFFLVGGRFSFAGDQASMLFDTLPPVVHVREASAQASVLRWSLDRLAEELRDKQPGGALVAEHLAHIMLVQILRLHLSRGEAGTGWLFALSDRRLRAALGAMHAEPGKPWTLAQLAALAGMSRSSFAERFRQVVGASPLAYLTRWRMLVAGDRLRGSGETVASLAVSLGYESESAFSTAFRRVMAVSPRQYRQG